MYKYIPIKETLYSEDLGKYTTFGIKILKATESGYAQSGFISDVSANILIVEEIARLSTEGQLSPLHITDVIENYI